VSGLVNGVFLIAADDANLILTEKLTVLCGQSRAPEKGGQYEKSLQHK
jgi:hypothetical protein